MLILIELLKLKKRVQNQCESSVTYTEVGHPSLLPLEQTIEHEVWLVLVEEDHLGVGVVTGRVEEVLQEAVDAVKVDVSAHDDELSLRVDLK